MNSKHFDMSELEIGEDHDLLGTAPGPTNKKKGGRPKKAVNDKLTEKLTINLTKNEMQKLEGFAEQNYGVPLATLVRNILQQQNII